MSEHELESIIYFLDRLLNVVTVVKEDDKPHHKYLSMETGQATWLKDLIKDLTRGLNGDY